MPLTRARGVPRIDFLKARQQHVTLPAAAAILLHEARTAIPPVKFPDDPGAALSIAEAALARLVGLGSTIALLSVKRSDLASALALIRKAGLPFALAIKRAPHHAGRS